MSQERIFSLLAKDLQLKPFQVEKCVELLDEGNTVPFIARYRKEATGEMTDEQVRSLQERLTYLRNLEAEKEKVLRVIGEQGKLTPELEVRIRAAEKLTEVEDLYRPYRPKRRTRAMIARERGLEPLALQMLAQAESAGAPEALAAPFVDAEKGVPDAAAALAGARDIIAETVSDDPEVRRVTRDLTTRQGLFETVASEKGDPEKAQEFQMYAEFKEPLRTLPPHRLLAINRGERLDCLKVTLGAPTEEIVRRIEGRYVKNEASIWAGQVREAIGDAYKRLIAPSIETEVRGELTEKAEERAIQIFAVNLKNLLLQPPIKGFNVLGVDPGFRTGCKLAVVDETGKVLATDVIYVTAGSEQARIKGEETLVRLIDKYKCDLIAIGNGTASRESEQVVAGIIPRCQHKTAYLIVSEAGASVYSASKLAQEEFPDFDVTQRSAVSIARRIQDPLAELVKIDPKSIGVGQYQHDVDQKKLAEQLGAVVEAAVNGVGVDLNTASAALLQYVAGIKAAVAKAIVEYREKNGKFKSRRELLKVSGLGPKAFEQCAGFLRVADGSEPLDNTGVHPESYPIAEAMLQAVGATRKQLIGQGAAGLRDALKELAPAKVAQELGAGLPTVRDILEALQKPGRDPREDLPKPIFHTEVLKLEDLQVGMELTGTVRNVVDFGAFVDIGVHEDGLVHVSQLSHKFIKHPSEAVAVGDIVQVRVIEVDVKRQRIGLTMKLGEAPKAERPAAGDQVGAPRPAGAGQVGSPRPAGSGAPRPAGGGQAGAPRPAGGGQVGAPRPAGGGRAATQHSTDGGQAGRPAQPKRSAADEMAAQLQALQSKFGPKR
ncbi:MAG TPA: Tex-like N-terminal domain-containing protein [Symbiobacteriaceae bacterium]|nr:Tex-like N-terminal domain-containing protein [Symbiobacteriaceae bacterium]